MPRPRRHFLIGAAGAFATAQCSRALRLAPVAPGVEPVIDIHQHTSYAGRSDADLLAHQARMGVTHTILLPAGTPMSRPSTHAGASNGLAAQVGGNDAALALSRLHQGTYFCFANQVSDADGAVAHIATYLQAGALGIGEQKFDVDCDSPHIERIAELADQHRVPVLLHFQHGRYNRGFERFDKILSKYPRVAFIGHAQTFWANIDRDHADQTVLYPTTKVTPGGLTDRYLAQYPNLYADLSANSGLGALMRDEDHARRFLGRHQDKLLYGSDCTDIDGRPPACQGARTLAVIRRLAPSKAVERKILFHNARRLLRL